MMNSSTTQADAPSNLIEHENEPEQVPTARAPDTRVTPGTDTAAQPSLILGGVVALMLSVWAGVAPYVGPTFGFSPDGTTSWTWDRAHLLGAAVPGAVGVLACLVIMSVARRPVGSLAPSGLAGSGILLFVSGAWLASFPVVWPALVGAYFQPASPLLTLADWMGLALGPGVLLACFGAFTMGRAGRLAHGDL